MRWKWLLFGLIPPQTLVLYGCCGARLTGAAFGGCKVNLVNVQRADEFAQPLSAGYESETGLHPDVYICQAA